MIGQNKTTKEKQIVLDRDLSVMNGLYHKQMLLDSLEGSDRLAINMENVSDCDSSGVQLLLALRKTALLNNQNVRLQSVPRVVFDAVSNYGIKLKELFNIE